MISRSDKIYRPFNIKQNLPNAPDAHVTDVKTFIT
jgi:hypothetical protein